MYVCVRRVASVQDIMFQVNYMNSHYSKMIDSTVLTSANVGGPY